MPQPIDPRRQWLAALGQPLRMAGLTLANRLMMSALTLQYGSDGLMSERHLAFYRERARGQVGLLFTEQLEASPVSASPFRHSLSAHDDRQIAEFQRVAAALSPFETKLFAQLFSAGAAGSSTVGISSWGAVRAPSNIPAPGSEVPSPLSEEEIAQIVQDYARSARNVRDGRLHGIEIHGAHGWLVGQFLSPFYNKRADRYGGGPENRCRLALEIGMAIRAEVGMDFPLGISLTYDELMGPEGITQSDTLAQLAVLDRERLFDYFDLSIGSSHQQHFTIASMAVAEGYSLPFAARAKSVVRPQTAILTSGRVTNVYMAGRAIAENQTDVVGMARALLADPYLLTKARAGESTGVTRCVGANYCVARALVDQPVTCVLNPVTGRESRWGSVRRAAAALRINVIGAGPAGLKFATVAAQSGHEVQVYERRMSAGGHLSVLARLPTREAWSDAVEDMVAALSSAGGLLKLGSEATVERALEGAPDVIVLAAGSSWVVNDTVLTDPTAGGAGWRRPRLLTLEAAIERATGEHGATFFAKHTLIVDATGTYAPLGLADCLSATGMHVTLATSGETLGLIAGQELDLQHVMPRLARRGVQWIVAHRVLAIGQDNVILESIWGSRRLTLSNVDCVVFAESRTPNNTLYDPLSARHPRVLCIGDARSPRSTAAVIHEGEARARALNQGSHP